MFTIPLKPSTCRSRFRRGSGSSTISTTIRNDSTCNHRATSTIRAISQTELKVRILAKTSSIGRGTSKRRVLGKHIIETCLATCRQTRERCRRRRLNTGDRGGWRCSHTISIAIGDNSSSDRSAAGAVCTVSETILEVHVAAEAGWNRRRASEC